ncbi:MAG: archaetidylserine decarboxylase [Pseudomonadota bacterium]
MTESLSLRQRAFVALQYAIPQRLLSRAIYHLTRSRWLPLKNALIRLAVRAFRIDLTEAADPDPNAYPSFNAFFTRPIKPAVRPMTSTANLACPADGAVSQLGPIEAGEIIQAKGRTFSVERFLTPEVREHAAFRDGQFVTIYLSPRDYHRVHMPCNGQLTKSVFVPGKLFSVAPATTRAIPELFARNERLVCLFDTTFGPVAQVLVGAVCVSSISTVWGGEEAPSAGPRSTRFDDVNLEHGAEMGRFNMGSTVVLLLPPGMVIWDQKLGPGVKVCMGQSLGALNGNQ